METRRFGRTGLAMPVFSLGGMRFQASWRESGQRITRAEQVRAASVIRGALERGITHIETARGYGTSERQLGMVLRDVPRDSYILQTKIAPGPDAGVFRRNFLESLARLRLDRVDLLSIHGVNTHEKLWWTLRPDGCLAVARALQQEGRVGFVGFSTHGSPELIVDAINTGLNGGFDYVNLHWYFIRRENDAALTAAAERDLGVFIISPADKGGRLYEPPQRLVELCEPVHPVTFNAAWCLSDPRVHTLSLGAARPEDFALHLAALPLIGDPEVGRIADRLDAAMTAALGDGIYERLLEGLPQWWQVPGHVNVRYILWLRALALGWDLTSYARERYGMLGPGSDWVPGLNAATADQFDLTRTLKDSPFASEIPEWLADAHRLLAGTRSARLGE